MRTSCFCVPSRFLWSAIALHCTLHSLALSHHCTQSLALLQFRWMCALFVYCPYLRSCVGFSKMSCVCPRRCMCRQVHLCAHGYGNQSSTWELSMSFETGSYWLRILWVCQAVGQQALGTYLTLKCWDYKCASSHLAFNMDLGIEFRPTVLAV